MIIPSCICQGSGHCICKEVDSLGTYVPNFQDELNYEDLRE